MAAPQIVAETATASMMPFCRSEVIAATGIVWYVSGIPYRCFDRRAHRRFTCIATSGRRGIR
jgi:hypothetical protein